MELELLLVKMPFQQKYRPCTPNYGKLRRTRQNLGRAETEVALVLVVRLVCLIYGDKTSEQNTPDLGSHMCNDTNPASNEKRDDKIERRRSRKEDGQQAEFHKCAFKYHMNIVRDGRSSKIDICIKAFTSIFDVTENRVRRVRDALATTGLPPKNKQGQHNNRPHALSQEEKDLVIGHIQSFRGRASHYSRKRTRRIIAFGYPRKDTCSTCDGLKCKIEGGNTQLNELPPDSERAALLLRQKDGQKSTFELHQRKGEVFYDRKKAARMGAQRSDGMEAVCFDYQKNLPCPNITTQDVYYSRQLSFHSFNIHVLSSDKVFFYCYDETVGKKGSDDVCSMLFDCFSRLFSHDVKHISLFCDSCAGQNKNWTVLRFMYYLVHMAKRFDTITMTLPVRGHSYMECDRDMANVDQSSPAEVPDDWRKVLEAARVKPEPFNVINMTSEKF
ncbi:hypothetical protein EGW08_020035 [Elysia chlorotica]|uniref:DUF7869 domain-containing protein n=1 Tax=Elysia chlorotica TaxID=188477 RepID=A0A433SSI5_ELYCH|nr:hypothetical protein EGW08_020035 [Elysia chlorotica]